MSLKIAQGKSESVNSKEDRQHNDKQIKDKRKNNDLLDTKQ